MKKIPRKIRCRVISISPSAIRVRKAASPPISEALIKNLSNLTLSPSTKFPPLLPEGPPQQPDREKKFQGLSDSIPYRRRGVRTLLTARKERMQRMIQIIKYRYSSQLPVLQRERRQKEIEVESRIQRFRCSCHYCLYHRDLSENTSTENNYDTEPTEP
ncbi:PREDICTED: developmental pluripotency-associated protein 3 [Ceratotherium simum simum]|uniref:Developmental pluripotency-associated protein 3 n=1 Tax=Ceratotherium simum simum TaxID=73337 RepID=A0ABM1DC01_CERSS|nr:PREDICTED: developmental pluripotency-associated protein 3 [Ceratotherium simum simum]